MKESAPLKRNVVNNNDVLVDLRDRSELNNQAWYQNFKEWRQRHSFLSLIFEIVLLFLFVVLPFRTLIAQPFVVSGDSMIPNFANKDYLIVNQLEKRFENGLNRFEVVVFKYPNDPSKYYIKRLIGLPGEQVIVKDGQTTIVNTNNPDGLIISDGYVAGETIGNIEITLASDEYFVMGDNRENSSDSRFWGALPKDNIIGTPAVRLYPFDNAGLQPGKVTP